MKTRNSDKHKDHGVTRKTLVCTVRIIEHQRRHMSRNALLLD
jgi:hypothetical protein